MRRADEEVVRAVPPTGGPDEVRRTTTEPVERGASSDEMTSTGLGSPPGSAVPEPPAGGESSCSLLAPSGADEMIPTARAPGSVLTDLNLDAVVAALVRGREEYDLGPLYESPPTATATVRYRQDAVRDLEDPVLRSACLAFAAGMRQSRVAFATAERRTHLLQRARIQLDAVRAYARSVAEFAAALGPLSLRSSGWQRLRAYLRAYVTSPRFRSWRAEADAIDGAIAEILFLVHLKGRRVTIATHRGEVDWGAEIERTFQRFERSEGKDRRFRWSEGPDLDPVEEQIVNRVAVLHPALFSRLVAIARAAAGQLDPRIARADREVQFFLAYLELTEPLRAREFPFALPSLVDPGDGESVEGLFDLALALRTAAPDARVVPNDYAIEPPERVLVVTGPNQGGKTTFARAFGQIHFLAALGLPVPARRARVSVPDRILTHFGVAERLDQGHGRLEDDLERLRSLLDAATASTVVVLNESFTAATVQDALAVGSEVLRRVFVRGSTAVCVTFLDELSRLGPETVSLVAEVARDDPNVRTFRLVRRPADGRAYARALAERHGLAYESLARRLTT